MRKGLYEELDELLVGDSDAGWDFFHIEDVLDEGEIDFLRFLKIEPEDYFPYMFLHGYCYAFASCLNLKYGYEMKGIYNENDKLVHAYCVAYKDKNPVFIDIRGCTSNWAEFIEEFRDELPDEISSKKEIPYPIPDTDSLIPDDFKYEDKTPFIVAKSIIDFNERFYNVWRDLWRNA